MAGGERQGAGRKPGSENGPKQGQAVYDVEQASHNNDPEKFLQVVMAANHIDLRFRMDAAKMLMTYTKPKVSKPTKKETATEKAKETSSKFYKPEPPKPNVMF